MKVYHNSNFTSKISSTIIAGILTFLWLFPSTIKDHPVLSKYLSPTSFSFSILWICSLMLTCMYWILLKRREHWLHAAHKKLNVESIQNELFESFIRIESYMEKNTKAITFSKDDLIKYFTGINIFSLQYEPLRRSTEVNTLISAFLPNMQRNIELELSQTLTDILIERAKKKNLIKVEQGQSLSDTYSHINPKFGVARTSPSPVIVEEFF